MKATLALLVVCLAAQAWSVEEPSSEKVAEFRQMLTEWSERASRIIRSLESAPSDEAHRASLQVQEALQQARGVRAKRDAPASPISDNSEFQNILGNLNEGMKSLIANFSSSPLYQQAQKLGESFGEEGKKLIGKLEDQVKNFQASKD